MKVKKNINGKEYWRSLDEVAETPEFMDLLHREFPENASELSSSVSRRKFLTLMGASLAFAGLAGCRRPVEKIVPYVVAPENIVPGNSLNYATAMPAGVNSYGLIVESHMGRPTKIEGNMKHSASLGKSNRLIQAEILNLYDPDRSNKIRFNNSDSSWDAFVAQWRKLQSEYSGNQGEGLAVLSRSFNSPTLYRLYAQFKRTFPKAKWVVHETVSDENIFTGLEKVSGIRVQPVYHFQKAKTILALDSDFLTTETDDICASNGFAKGRRIEQAGDKMNRLYVVENIFTTTGAMADHRLRLPSQSIAAFTLAVAHELKAQGAEINLPDIPTKADSFNQNWLKAVAKDLLSSKGQSIIVAGPKQTAAVHGLCALMNDALSNTGKTVEYTDLPEAVLPNKKEILDLADTIKTGSTKGVIFLGTNPVFDAPSDLKFSELIAKLEESIHFGLYQDETAAKCTWHVPMAHFLESWSDVNSIRGDKSIIQPMIQPLFGGIEEVKMLNLFATGKDESSYDIVRTTWQDLIPNSTFEKDWQRTLAEGVFGEAEFAATRMKFNSSNLNADEVQSAIQIASLSIDNLEIVFQPSAALVDGRYSNNGWLQEMPDAITKLSWDNPAIISPKTAEEMELKNEDLVTLDYDGKQITLPIWVVPGHADYSVTVNLGYGRKNLGRIANGVGVDVYPLRNSSNLYFASGAKITSTGRTFPMANTQDHGSMEGRPIVREATIEGYQENPTFAPDMVQHPPLKSLWEERPYDEGNQWGMVIDLNACTGCNACMIACQSENNIPIVGKEQVRNGREMSWIRMDRYFSGDINDPEMVYQPVACQHCENAPCEQVCPVAATSHDEEGLNVMTYNRCVGTRYCANNCPYKVRRFNFFNYTKDYPETIKMAQNPDVTVRSRGVMEKCTYCTQRIEREKITAKNEGRELKDGDVISACQQSCPTDAIVFGNIIDLKSSVSKLKANDRTYEMLDELNVKPRTSYMAKLRNPNPELQKVNA